MIYKKIEELKDEGVSHDPGILKRVFIRNHVLPNITNISQAILKPNQIVSAHVHQDMYEVFYIIDGEGLMIINGKKIALNKGCFIAVEPGEEHSIINNDYIEMIINYFGIKNYIGRRSDL